MKIYSNRSENIIEFENNQGITNGFIDNVYFEYVGRHTGKSTDSPYRKFKVAGMDKRF